jgi:hypothetical protein
MSRPDAPASAGATCFAEKLAARTRSHRHDATCLLEPVAARARSHRRDAACLFEPVAARARSHRLDATCLCEPVASHRRGLPSNRPVAPPTAIITIGRLPTVSISRPAPGRCRRVSRSRPPSGRARRSSPRAPNRRAVVPVLAGVMFTPATRLRVRPSPELRRRSAVRARSARDSGDRRIAARGRRVSIPRRRAEGMSPSDHTRGPSACSGFVDSLATTGGPECAVGRLDRERGCT